MANIPHSGTMKVKIIQPVGQWSTGQRLIVSDPSVRMELSLVCAKLDAILEELQKEAS